MVSAVSGLDGRAPLQPSGFRRWRSPRSAGLRLALVLVAMPLALVEDAIRVVVRRLSAMQPSPEVDALRCHAVACQEQVHAWTWSVPTAEEREVVTERVLGLHLAVARLKRAVP
jgi:hypothetical protein